ncbi:MAG: hypothetical protein QM760_03840 [Nibricoccus sp.]
MMGAAVLLAGIVPFVLVGKSPVIAPAVDGMSAFDATSQQILAVIDTRMHLFLGPAVGFVAVYGLRWVAGLASLDRRVVTVGLVAILAACVTADTRFYLQLEKRRLMRSWTARAFRARPELKEYGIVGVVDRTNNISTTWDSWPLFFKQSGETEPTTVCLNFGMAGTKTAVCSRGDDDQPTSLRRSVVALLYRAAAGDETSDADCRTG